MTVINKLDARILMGAMIVNARKDTLGMGKHVVLRVYIYIIYIYLFLKSLWYINMHTMW